MEDYSTHNLRCSVVFDSRWDSAADMEKYCFWSAHPRARRSCVVATESFNRGCVIDSTDVLLKKESVRLPGQRKRKQQEPVMTFQRLFKDSIKTEYVIQLHYILPTYDSKQLCREHWSWYCFPTANIPVLKYGFKIVVDIGIFMQTASSFLSRFVAHFTNNLPNWAVLCDVILFAALQDENAS